MDRKDTNVKMLKNYMGLHSGEMRKNKVNLEAT